MDSLRDLKWPAAAIVLGMLATIFGLVAWGGQSLKDISLFVGGAATAYIAWRQSMQGKVVDRVEANTNGTNAALHTRLNEKDAQMIAMAEKHAKTVAMLTAGLPPGTPLPQSLSEPESDEPQATGPLSRRLPSR